MTRTEEEGRRGRCSCQLQIKHPKNTKPITPPHRYLRNIIGTGPTGPTVGAHFVWSMNESEGPVQMRRLFFLEKKKIITIKERLRPTESSACLCAVSASHCNNLLPFAVVHLPRLTAVNSLYHHCTALHCTLHCTAEFVATTITHCRLSLFTLRCLAAWWFLCT